MLYVDDVLVAEDDIEEIMALKTYLHKLFMIKDLGEAKYFLGLEITRTK